MTEQAKTILDLVNEKQLGSKLYVTDLLAESEDEGWLLRHPTGPVHVKISCKLCGEVLATDLKEFGWLQDPDYWMQHFLNHLKTHL